MASFVLNATPAQNSTPQSAAALSISVEPLMKYIYIAISIFIASCEREVYSPIGQFYFKSTDANKISLLALLDEYAEKEYFFQLQQGGEGMKAEEKEIFIHAVYQNTDKYQFSINNILNRNCFAVAVYDKGGSGGGPAKVIVSKLRDLVSKRFTESYVEYDNPSCDQKH